MCRSLYAHALAALFLLTAGVTPAAAQTGAPAPAPAPAADPASSEAFLTVGAGADYVSAFIWRGFLTSDMPCLQPSAWAVIGPVTVTSWMNLERHGTVDYSFAEHDLTLDYSRQLGGVTLSAGWINYFFSNVETGRHSNEFYAGVSLGGFLAPSLQVFYDAQEGHGTYVSFGVSHSFPVAADRLTLIPSMTIGYNDHQWIDQSGFSDLNLGLQLEIPVARVLVQPFFNYTFGSSHLGLPTKAYGGFTVTTR